ncbi:MAG: VWA domain-containing protein [Lachnospiraceae bacterium]|nr:VWA domain-containing protein [Lachnospiraceae bacterium]
MNNINLESASEMHMACVFLIDTSKSMQAFQLSAINDALAKFKLDITKDKMLREVLDIAVVEFNSSVNVVQEFLPVKHMIQINFAGGDGTVMSPAIQKAIDLVTERLNLYRRMGVPFYKPWVILVSGSVPEDDTTDIAQVVKQLEQQGRIQMISLGVENYDSQTLHCLSGSKVMKAKEYDFTSFFDWVNKSMYEMSDDVTSDYEISDDATDEAFSGWM